MNPFIQHMVNQQINQLTPEKLQDLAEQYNEPITPKQAKRIVAILKQEEIDITNEVQRDRIINKIKREIDPSSAKKIDALLAHFF